MHRGLIGNLVALACVACSTSNDTPSTDAAVADGAPVIDASTGDGASLADAPTGDTSAPDASCCAAWQPDDCSYTRVNGVCNACCQGDACGFPPDLDGGCSGPVGPAGSPCSNDADCGGGQACVFCFGAAGCYGTSAIPPACADAGPTDASVTGD